MRGQGRPEEVLILNFWLTTSLLKQQVIAKSEIHTVRAYTKEFTNLYKVVICGGLCGDWQQMYKEGWYMRHSSSALRPEEKTAIFVSTTCLMLISLPD